MKMQTNNKTYPIPGSISVAIVTGRPELARFGLETETVTKETINQFSDFAENCVREMIAERGSVTIVRNTLAEAVKLYRGALAHLTRIEDALQAMEQGLSSEVVLEKLKNPRHEGA